MENKNPSIKQSIIENGEITIVKFSPSQSSKDKMKGSESANNSVGHKYLNQPLPNKVLSNLTPGSRNGRKIAIDLSFGQNQARSRSKEAKVESGYV